MSNSSRKPLNRVMVPGRLKLSTAFNLWGPVLYPESLASQINYQSNVYEKCVGISVAAAFPLLLGIMMFFACRVRRRYSRSRKIKSKIRFCSNNGKKSQTETLVDGAMSTKTSNKMANKSVCVAESHLQSSNLLTADEIEKEKIETSNYQVENNVPVTTAKPNLFLLVKNNASCFVDLPKEKRGKPKPRKFQDWRISLFEQQQDAVTSV